MANNPHPDPPQTWEPYFNLDPSKPDTKPAPKSAIGFRKIPGKPPWNRIPINRTVIALNKTVSPMRNCILSLYVFLQGSSCLAQETLYSFSGNVSRLFYDGGGILTAHNLNVGDPVSASYVVDFGAPGFYLLNDGSVDVPANPPLGNVHTTYFYCRWASGTLLPEANGGFNNRPQDIAEYFTGWNQSSPSGNEGLLQGGTGDSYFSVRKSSLSSSGQVQDWQVGTEVSGVLVAWSDQDWSIAWADMRLDSITAVPEPSAIPLFSFGGAALLLWGRQRANKNGCRQRRDSVLVGYRISLARRD